MKEITVKDIIGICNAKLLIGKEEEILENFKKDTREIEKNDVYVGIKGEKFNGSDFFEEAIKKGAKVCILQDVQISEETLKKYNEKAILIVKDTVEALQKIAEYKREKYDIPVVRSNWKCWKNQHKRYFSKCNVKKI